jgi:hypothetical protein
MPINRTICKSLAKFNDLQGQSRSKKQCNNEMHMQLGIADLIKCQIAGRHEALPRNVNLSDAPKDKISRRKKRPTSQTKGNIVMRQANPKSSLRHQTQSSTQHSIHQCPSP